VDGEELAGFIERDVYFPHPVYIGIMIYEHAMFVV
jgi:hypothetical protein